MFYHFAFAFELLIFLFITFRILCYKYNSKCKKYAIDKAIEKCGDQVAYNILLVYMIETSLYFLYSQCYIDRVENNFLHIFIFSLLGSGYICLLVMLLWRVEFNLLVKGFMTKREYQKMKKDLIWIMIYFLVFIWFFYLVLSYQEYSLYNL